MNWHAPPELLASYAQGDLDHARTLSIEAHTLRCSECQARLADLAALWWTAPFAIADAIDAPRCRGRTAVALGSVTPGARSVGTTPSLRMNWFVSTWASLSLGVVCRTSPPALLAPSLS